MNKSNFKKAVAVGRWWTCENLDLLAPITQNGVAILYTDGTQDFFKDGENPPLICWATESEKKAFGNALGIVYDGDEVTIFKGRLKGENKVVNGFFSYVVPHTYGKAYTDYLTFSDGTKTNIKNCLISGKPVLRFNEKPTFSVGGRI